MQNQNIIKYVDQVISKADIPAEYKAELENELIRNIITASDNPDIDDVKSILCSPEKLAEELTKKYKGISLLAERNRYIQSQDYCPPPPRHHQRYSGEYMHEQSNVNLKLLYIPLLQISSGTDRMTMPLMEDDC